MQIQFRRGSTIPTTESAAVGEPFYDPLTRRFGVFPNIDASTIDWFPRFSGNQLRVNEGQLLSGDATGSVANNVVFDWSTPNQLVVKNVSTGTVYATFQETGVGLHSPTSTVDVVEGLNNRAINGNLAVIDPLTPSAPVSTSSATYRSYAYQPNWLLWKNASASGNITVALTAGSGVFDGVNNFFTVTTSGAPNGHGLSQLYSYFAFAGRTICVGGRYIGPAGETVKIRIIHDSGIILRVYTHTATGGTDDVFTTVLVPTGLTPGRIRVDFVYNPSETNAGSSVWQAGRFFVNLGVRPKPYESLGYTETLGLLEGLFSTGKIYAYGTDVASVPLAFESLSDTKVSAGTVILASDQHGLALNNAANSATTLSVLQYSAHSLPRSAETI